MLNVQNIIKNPNPTYLEVGKLAFLYCELINFKAEKCVFYIYRVDGLNKKIDNKKEIIIHGEKNYNGYSLDENVTELKSIQPVSPKLSWFEEDEEEIKAAFDIEVNGSRIKSKDHTLIIKKGDITMNLYWGEEYKESEKQKVRIYNEYLTRKVDRNYPNDIGYHSKFRFEINRISPKLIHPYSNWKYSGSLKIYEESRNNRKRKGIFIIAESEEIDLTHFFEYFCEVNLLPKLLDTDYQMRGENFQADKEELKTFKRDHLKSGKEILFFLREKELIPDLFYDNILTQNEAMAHLKEIEAIKSAISDIKDIIKNRSLHGFAISRLQDFAGLLYKNWKDSNYEHVFFKAEYGIAIRYLKQTKPERKEIFNKWLESKMGMLPGSTEFNNRSIEIQNQVDSFNALPPALQDRSYELYLNARVSILNEMIENFQKFQKMFETIELSTTTFLEKSAKKTNYKFY